MARLVLRVMRRGRLLASWSLGDEPLEMAIVDLVSGQELGTFVASSADTDAVHSAGGVDEVPVDRLERGMGDDLTMPLPERTETSQSVPDTEEAERPDYASGGPRATPRPPRRSPPRPIPNLASRAQRYAISREPTAEITQEGGDDLMLLTGELTSDFTGELSLEPTSEPVGPMLTDEVPIPRGLTAELPELSLSAEIVPEHSVEIELSEDYEMGEDFDLSAEIEPELSAEMAQRSSRDAQRSSRDAPRSSRDAQRSAVVDADVGRSLGVEMSPFDESSENDETAGLEIPRGSASPAEVWVRRRSEWRSDGHIGPGQRVGAHGASVRLSPDGRLVVSAGALMAGSGTLLDGTTVEIPKGATNLALAPGASVLLRAGDQGIYVRSEPPVEPTGEWGG